MALDDASLSEPHDIRERTADDVIMSVRDLNVAFEMDRGVARIVDDVNINILRGEILGVAGESGSGKSMFVSALLDAVVEPGQVSGEITYYPESGEEVDILDLSKEQLKRLRWEEISMVFQGAQSSFNPTINVKKHFIETLDAHGRDRTEGMENARQLLRDLHLTPDRVLDSYPHELSGGMKQRTLIALSLLLDPDVLLMDEPTAALDLLMQRSIIHLLESIQEKYGITLLFITHDLPLLTELSDRIAILYSFQFVEIGPTEEILEGAAHPYTRALLSAVPNIDAPLEEMRPIEGSSPDPVNVPSGCSYHPRCQLADEQCELKDPEFHHVSEGHAARCYYWEQARETVPVPTPKEETDSSSDADTRS